MKHVYVKSIDSMFTVKYFEEAKFNSLISLYQGELKWIKQYARKNQRRS